MGEGGGGHFSCGGSGWVGGWVNEAQAVRPDSGWVGGWVGGRLAFIHPVDRWVCGWVGGWVGRH